jgi:P27 family predicted phage terminase small subunit
MSTTNTPAPPGHLSAGARELFDSIVDSYEFTADETDTLATLTLALEAWDMARIARNKIKREGLIVTTSQGNLQPHPAVKIHKDCLTTWSRLLGQLGIPDAGEEEKQAKDRRGRFAPKGSARASR